MSFHQNSNEEREFFNPVFLLRATNSKRGETLTSCMRPPSLSSPQPSFSRPEFQHHRLPFSGAVKTSSNYLVVRLATAKRKQPPPPFNSHPRQSSISSALRSPPATSLVLYSRCREAFPPEASSSPACSFPAVTKDCYSLSPPLYFGMSSCLMLFSKSRTDRTDLMSFFFLLPRGW